MNDDDDEDKGEDDNDGEDKGEDDDNEEDKGEEDDDDEDKKWMTMMIKTKIKGRMAMMMKMKKRHELTWCNARPDTSWSACHRCTFP